VPVAPIENWSLNLVLRPGDVGNEADLSFVKDPFNSTTKEPVLAIFYPAGAFTSEGIVINHANVAE
jgi:hypothetical protein